MERDLIGRSDAPHAGDHFLVCRANSWLCALPLNSVEETMRPLRCEPIAAMPAFMLGVSIIRGDLVPIVDAARVLGCAVPTHPGRIVTLKAGARRVGLAVESVVGIRVLARSSLDTAQPLLHQVSADIVSAVTTLDHELLYVLKGACIIPEPVWTAMAS